MQLQKIAGYASLICLLVASTATAQHGLFDNIADWGPLGSTKVEGSVEVTGSGEDAVYTLEANGNDIWTEIDEGFFVYTEESGAVSIQARVDWIDPGTNEWSKAGVMIRQFPQSATSPHFWNMLRGNLNGDQSGPQYRPAPESVSFGEDNLDADGNLVGNPGDGLWLRVSRAANNVFFSEWSTNGTDWTVSYATVIKMSEPFGVGLASTSHTDDDQLVQSEFTDVAITQPEAIAAVRTLPELTDLVFEPGESYDVIVHVGGADTSALVTEEVPEGWAVSNISHDGVLDGNTITWDMSEFSGGERLTYTVTAPQDASEDAVFAGGVNGIATFGGDVIPAPKPIGLFDNHLDVGDVDAAGSAELNGESYIVQGSGGDIWGGADEFHYVYSKMSGSFRITVDEIFLDPGPSTSDWVKAGVMVRDSLEADSPNYFEMVNTAFDLRSQWRNEEGGESFGGSSIAADTHITGHMELVKFGNTFTAYTFDQAGELIQVDTRTMENIEDPVYAGLGITSHQDGDLSTAEFVGVDVQQIPFTTTRSVPETEYAPGGMVEGIEVTVVPAEGESTSAVVTEQIPSGATPINIEVSNGDASFAGGELTWTLSEASEAVTLSYDLQIAEGAEVALELSGNTAEGAFDINHGSVWLTQESGLSDDWVFGNNAGAWAVTDDGVLRHFSTNGHDPKHLWVDAGLETGNYTVIADVRMATWEDGDPSRAGVAIRINPDDNGNNPGSDRGINLIFHEDTNSLDFLNDLVTFGPQLDVAWEVGTWYTMALSGDEDIVEGFFIERGTGDVLSDGFLEVWDDAEDRNVARSPGFPGLTGVTGQGLAVEFDNFRVLADGEEVFADTFDETVNVDDWALF